MPKRRRERQGKESDLNNPHEWSIPVAPAYSNRYTDTKRTRNQHLHFDYDQGSLSADYPFRELFVLLTVMCM
jgi:hypothetical protein